jgi:prolyl 4-hydroxylase
MEGFKVIEAPAIVKEQLNEYWKNNKNRMKEERWPKGATAVNHWASPTYIVKAKENGLRGSGARLEEVVKEATKRSLEQWTHMEMKPAAVHGIRVHTEGAIIPPHVVGTKAPLMHSAIVNVAQSLDESWVLELYKRDGSAVNITLEPGSMLLFESSSLIYGVSPCILLYSM